MEFFKHDIGTFFLRELKKTSDGFASKNFLISNHLANYLRYKYNLKTRWVDGGDFLAELSLPLIIRKARDSVPVFCDQFQMKFGNKRRSTYFSGENVRDRRRK